VEQAERLAQITAIDSVGHHEVKRLCRRARGISRFVHLWCHMRERGAAVQLAAAERFTWPLPYETTDPCELMQAILSCETNSFAA
jgi:hypothetical protein